MSTKTTLGHDIIEALNGPKHCTKVVIEHNVREIPRVTFTCLVYDPALQDNLRQVLLRYRIVKRKVKVSPSVERQTLDVKRKA